MARKAHNEADVILRYTVRVPADQLEKHGTAAAAVRAAIGDMNAMRQELANSVISFNDGAEGFGISGMTFEVKR